MSAWCAIVCAKTLLLVACVELTGQGSNGVEVSRRSLTQNDLDGLRSFVLAGQFPVPIPIRATYGAQAGRSVGDIVGLADLDACWNDPGEVERAVGSLSSDHGGQAGGGKSEGGEEAHVCWRR